MAMEFPTKVVALLACPGCGDQLSSTPEGTPEGTPDGTAEGRPAGGRAGATCRGCGAAYPVRDGILRMLNACEVDRASAQEMTLRDGEAEAAFEAGRDAEGRAAATALTLRALGEAPSG